MRGSSFYIDESNIHRKRRVSSTDKPQNGQPPKETPAKLRKFEPAVDINELNLDNWSWCRNSVSILTSIIILLRIGTADVVKGYALFLWFIARDSKFSQSSHKGHLIHNQFLLAVMRVKSDSQSNWAFEWLARQPVIQLFNNPCYEIIPCLFSLKESARQDLWAFQAI